MSAREDFLRVMRAVGPAAEWERDELTQLRIDLGAHGYCEHVVDAIVGLLRIAPGLRAEIEGENAAHEVAS